MINKVSRNAYAGYTYQQYVHLFFVLKMDAEKMFNKIECEIISNDNFDDVYLEQENGSKFCVQIKNYSNTSLSDITITEEYIKIKNNKSYFCKNATNVIVINSKLLNETNDTIFGLPCININGIYIIPLTTETIEQQTETIYSDYSRAYLMAAFLSDKIVNRKFELNIKDLPPNNRLSTDLHQKTVLLRDVGARFNNGINFIIGKPGVGKSHYVNELCEKSPDALVYRFWIGAQDPEKQKRLIYETFLKDLAIGVFESNKAFKENELIEKILAKNKLIIIDGLDHVENYNIRDLEKYFAFFEKIKQAKVVVLTRPLKHNIEYPCFELSNWSRDETYEYLNKAYSDFEYSHIMNIYEKTNGYPIITYYLAEHFRIYGKLNFKNSFVNINEFYDELLISVENKMSLSFFVLNDSFWQYDEIITLIKNDFISNAIIEFTKNYPYLFTITANRVSLIHDSFNTYLKGSLNLDSWQYVVDAVKKSILNKNINYLSRFTSFNFDNNFIENVLKQYADITVFEEISSNTFDYFSIQEFYAQLKTILQSVPKILTIYQYYSFVLITLITERYNIEYDYELLYNILFYYKNNSIDETKIFNQGFFWEAYIMYNYQKPISFEFYLKEKYRKEEMFITCDASDGFFKTLKEKAITYDNLDTVLKMNFVELEKSQIITKYLVSIIINNDFSAPFYDIVKKYLEFESQESIDEINEFSNRYEVRTVVSKFILRKVKYKLWELGIIKKGNPFLNHSLHSLILEKSNLDSFDVNSYVVSYIRLANFKKRQIDINSLNLYFRMHYAHKDYSVNELHKILVLFESKRLLNEKKSKKILIRTIEQSKKGVQHLLSEYINLKPDKYISNHLNHFSEDEIDYVNIFDLCPSKINLLSKDIFIYKLVKMLKYRYYSQSIEYYEVKNVFNSKYKSIFLEMLFFSNYKLKGVPQELKDDFKQINVDFSSNNNSERIENSETIEEKGYISKEDIEQIDFNTINCEKLASYTDGWFSCFPFPDIFGHYDKELIKEHALKIIHTALFAKAPKTHKTGNWWLCPFSIIKFCDLYNINVKWKKLYFIFKKFIELSLIDF